MFFPIDSRVLGNLLIVIIGFDSCALVLLFNAQNQVIVKLVPYLQGLLSFGNLRIGFVELILSGS